MLHLRLREKIKVDSLALYLGDVTTTCPFMSGYAQSSFSVHL